MIISYDHNDLYAAFEAGWREAYQAMVLDPHTIQHEFEDWLRNHEHR